MPNLNRWYRPAGVALIALLAVAWIASGVITREPPQPSAPRTVQPMTVAVEERTAEPVERVLVLQGRVEPDLRVTVRAETAGQVEQWQATAGTEVAAGDLLAQLRMDDREARRRQALARVRGKESELESTRQLVEERYTPELELEARQAELEAARAELEAIELDIRNTEIRSPVDGVVNRRIAERGDYVGVGDPIAEIVDNHPLLAVVQVTQHQIGRVQPGQPARIRFLDGRQVEGVTRHVTAVADPATRTFRVEIEVPNPQRALPSGISAGVEIPTDTVAAYKVSPAIISLDDEGRVGLKTVDDDDRVAFHPIEVIRTAPDGVWVVGLPPQARIIVTGQGFVTAGEPVIPHLRENASAAAGGGTPQ